MSDQTIIAALEARVDSLELQLAQAKEDAKSWKGTFELYRNAWRREIGPLFVSKVHEIDSLVLTTQWRLGQPRPKPLNDYLRQSMLDLFDLMRRDPHVSLVGPFKEAVKGLFAAAHLFPPDSEIYPEERKRRNG